MPQVLIVSNRLPVSVTKVDGKLTFSTSIGGLATGLSSLVSNRQNKWIGWPGITDDELTAADKQVITKRLAKDNYIPVFLTRKQVNDFYNGYSNALLWPLFHSLPFKDPEKHAAWWRAYHEVNKIFAEATLRLAKSSSNIWVHDYQLMLVPEMIRVARPELQIGFFLHIPFPPAKVFSKLSESRQLLKGVLGADLIGFHTPGYVNDFIANCSREKLGITEVNQVILPARSVRVTDFPMGIDYKKFSAASKLPAVKKAVQKYKKQYRGRKIIAAVDRLDISKGFVERLAAYQQFLAKNKKLHGKVVFVLVGAPSRTEIDAYKKLAYKVDKLAAEINSTFGSSKWQPVDYINHAIPFEQVTALFQIADVAFIAPLRDGMNLVAKEFVASSRNQGVLILSETAGAAEELHDAIVVNHSQPDSLVAALEQALSMQSREMTARLKRMQRHLSENTVQAWAGDFMKTLQKPVPLPKISLNIPSQLTTKLATNMERTYSKAKKSALFLDYDGTLSPIVTRPEDAASSGQLLKILKKLGDNPNNDIFIISGRSRKDLEAWLGHLPVTLIAEHGAFERAVGKKKWLASGSVDASWKEAIKPLLESYGLDTPGAWVEEKSTALVWHYREASTYRAQKTLVSLKRVLKPSLAKLGLEAHDGKMILEIKHKDTSKGAQVAKKVAAGAYDFILTIGDDYTDESMFKVMPTRAFSIKVGAGKTSAGLRAKNTAEILDLLKRLAA